MPLKYLIQLKCLINNPLLNYKVLQLQHDQIKFSKFPSLWFFKALNIEIEQNILKDITFERIKFTDDDKYLISASWDRSLGVWDLDTKKQINQIHCDSQLQGLAFSNKLQLIACQSDKGQAYLFQWNNLNKLILGCIEFIKNSTILMTSSRDETKFWNIEDLEKNKLINFKEIKDGGWTVKAYPINNPQIIINCNYYYSINIWDYNSTQLMERIEISYVLQQSFVITSDFKNLIIGQNKKVQIFQQK